MGLAAIDYDASHDDTTSGFIRPSSPSSPSLSDDCEYKQVIMIHDICNLNYVLKYILFDN